LTIRADDDLREELQRRAAAEGKTVSETVREILRQALSEEPLGNKVGHLKGRLTSLPQDSDPWRKKLRDHNWRP